MDNKGFSREVNNRLALKFSVFVNCFQHLRRKFSKLDTCKLQESAAS